MATAARRPPARRIAATAKSSTAKPRTAKPSTAKASTAKPPEKAARTRVAPAKVASPPKVVAPKKPKRVRGDFAIPEIDFERIARLKAVAERAGINVKKNELIRLGLQALQSLTSAELHDRIRALRLPEGR